LLTRGRRWPQLSWLSARRHGCPPTSAMVVRSSPWLPARRRHGRPPTATLVAAVPTTDFTVGEQMAAMVWEDSRRWLGRRDREGIRGETWEGTERGGGDASMSREEGGGGGPVGAWGLG
jgi:hypothetical protein